MKKIKMTPTTFWEFKRKANEIALWFDYKIVKSIVYIEADASKLEKLGY